MKSGAKGGLTLLFLVLFPSSAYAPCTANVTNLAFGSVNTLSGSPQYATAVASFTCTGIALTTMQICANLGIGTGGSGPSGVPRYLLSGSNQLAYQIYQDAGYTQVWGSFFTPYSGSPGSASLLIPLSLAGTGSGSLTLYGVLSGGQQTAPIGGYSSTFTSTLTDVRFVYFLYAALPCSALSLGTTLSPSFTVSGNIPDNCTLTTSPVSFGTITSLVSDVHGTGTVSVTCTTSTSYHVGLDNGLNGTGPTARKMAFGINRLTYGLYSDGGYSVAWGNSIGQLVSGTGTGNTQNLTVYGTVFAQTAPVPGTYIDTVVATVTY